MGRALLDEPRSLQPGRGRPREGPRDAAADGDVNTESLEEEFVGQKSGPREGRESRADFTPLLPLLKRTRQTHHTAIIYIRTPRRWRWPPLTSIVYSLQWLPAIIVIKRVFMVDTSRPPPLPFQEPQEFYLR